MDDTPGEAMSTKSEVTESSSALSVNDQVDECYICCEGASLAPLVRGVCACRGTAMHVACQQRMLDSAVAVDAGQLTLCRVCRTSFSNAEIYTYWYPSTACTVWCAWVMGAWAYGCTGAWVHGGMGVCVHGCMGAWVYGCTGAWVYGCMGA